MEPLNSQQFTDYPVQHLGYPTGYEADRDRQSRKLDRVLELGGYESILATPESRLEFLDSLTLDTFEELITNMNGILINVPRTHRKYADQLQMISGGKNGTPLDIMPPPELKRELLGSVLHTAQKLEGSLEDKAMILAVGINAVHPFTEANGRVARATFHLLTNGYLPQDSHLMDLLGEEGESILTPDPNVLRPAIMGGLKLDLATHTYEPSEHIVRPILPVIAGQDGSGIIETVNNGSDLEQQVVGLLFQEDLSEMISATLIRDGSNAARNAITTIGNTHFFDIGKFWKIRTNDDVNRIYELCMIIKREFVLRLLEELSAGENSNPIVIPENGNGSGGREVPMGTLMKAVIHKSIDLSGKVTAATKIQTTSTSVPEEKPKLTRQQRRQLERQEAKKAKRKRPIN